MKHIIHLLLVLSIHIIIFVPSGKAQENRNYIRQTTINRSGIHTSEQVESLPIGEKYQTTQYFDGLGRPLQTVVRQGSKPTGQPATDMVSPVYYDALGRETLKYLPYSSTENNGLFKDD